MPYWVYLIVILYFLVGWLVVRNTNDPPTACDNWRFFGWMVGPFPVLAVWAMYKEGTLLQGLTTTIVMLIFFALCGGVILGLTLMWDRAEGKRRR